MIIINIIEETNVEEERKIFGLKPLHFRGAAIGVAFGWVIAGVVAIMGLPWISDYGSCILFGGIGYFLVRTIEKIKNKKIEEL